MAPEYMIPSAFHWRRQLRRDGPRQDRSACVDGSGRGPRARRARGRRPRTATERWLAEAWADVLAVPKDQIGQRIISSIWAAPALGGEVAGSPPTRAVPFTGADRSSTPGGPRHVHRRQMQQMKVERHPVETATAMGGGQRRCGPVWRSSIRGQAPAPPPSRHTVRSWPRGLGLRDTTGTEGRVPAAR